MPDPLLKYKIGISLIPKIGPVLTKRLIAYCGSLEGVFKENKRNLLKIPGIGKKLIDHIVSNNVLEQADKEIEYTEQNNISVIFYLDNNYPQRLKQCEDAPVVIYAKGNTNFNKTKMLSIVGTRSATNYGRDLCNKLIDDLALHGHDITIISGLAYGIDICAHRAALHNNLETIAVLGHGLSVIYPSVHKNTARQIVEKGALVTEFMGSGTPEPQNFVKRNRIIAGLADATIVIESGEKGGALITADIANSYNRDVFAYPGKVNDKYSIGCNKLIKTNKAALIEDINDLEYIMGWQNENKKNVIAQKKLFVELNEEESTIMELFDDNQELSIDQIAINSNMPLSKISFLLINLEFNGLLKCLPGKVYKKIG